jgi:hypothetical protein
MRHIADSISDAQHDQLTPTFVATGEEAILSVMYMSA